MLFLKHKTIYFVTVGNGLTNMTISLYKHLVFNMPPSPTKMHYLFSLRDISKVTIIYNRFDNHYFDYTELK